MEDNYFMYFVVLLLLLLLFRLCFTFLSPIKLNAISPEETLALMNSRVNDCLKDRADFDSLLDHSVIYRISLMAVDKRNKDILSKLEGGGIVSPTSYVMPKYVSEFGLEHKTETAKATSNSNFGRWFVGIEVLK